jgi:hypothetical protein
MTDQNWKTESPKFKMLKMRHDIDNLAFMLKEHCESHPESVTVKGLPELSNRDLSIAVNNLVSRVNKIDNLDKIEPKPVEDSPLTLDQCEVGMPLECLASLSYIPNEDRIYKGDILTIGNIQKTLLYCTEKPLRAIAKDELSYFRIHKPAPAVVHYPKPMKLPDGRTICHCDTITEYYELNWGRVTCADCLKHKPKTLTPSDCVGRKIRCVRVPVRGFQGYPKNWIEVGEILTCYQKGKFSFAGYPDYTLSEKDLTHFELVPEDMVEVPKSEWDKLQSDKKDFWEKIRELIQILDINSQKQ